MTSTCLQAFLPEGLLYVFLKPKLSDTVTT